MLGCIIDGYLAFYPVGYYIYQSRTILSLSSTHLVTLMVLREGHCILDMHKDYNTLHKSFNTVIGVNLNDRLHIDDYLLGFLSLDIYYKLHEVDSIITSNSNHFLQHTLYDIERRALHFGHAQRLHYTPQIL